VLVSEFRFRHADGGWRWLSSTTVLDTRGGSHDLCYMVDVTDRHLAENELRDARRAAEAANASKTEFLSRMSHELRTPLNAVLGFAQLLTLDPTLDARHLDSANQVLRAGRHLLHLIDEVLDIARIESGHISISTEPIPLRQVAAESVDLVRSLAREHGVALELRGGPADVYIRGDTRRVKQVLTNLLTNAVKYNRTGGHAWLAWDTSGDTVEITVDDDGLGMTDEQLARVFTPFDRLGREASEIEGHGIGLALTHRLVTLMNGSITLDSTPDHGTRVTVCLERADAVVEAAAAAIQPTWPAQRSGARQKVVYVEDNLSNIVLMRQILGAFDDLDLVTVTRAVEALDLIRLEPPALVILDVNLPDLTGDQVLRALKAFPETEHVPVVVLTADATEATRQRLTEAGAHAYLTKPVDVTELRRLLDDAFSRVRQ